MSAVAFVPRLTLTLDPVVHAEVDIADACADLLLVIARSQSADEVLGLHLKVQGLVTLVEHVCAATLLRADELLRARD